MLNYTVLSEDSGKVLAVLSYCSLSLGQEIARQYSRVLAVPVSRNMMRCAVAPVVGSVLPELVRGTDDARRASLARLAHALKEG